MIPAKGKCCCRYLIYQNETVSKPAESGEIEQQARDRGRQSKAKTQRILFKRERLMWKARKFGNAI